MNLLKVKRARVIMRRKRRSRRLWLPKQTLKREVGTVILKRHQLQRLPQPLRVMLRRAKLRKLRRKEGKQGNLARRKR